ncbi:hypothetical protein [Planctobacterium marinum]|uniref:Uncharacterized protein n=1 Tax=Planctobacterium marinum TaxID=1631968 RepID=A0AA48KQZ0_9ALTE|nr:hypothetical protein MACH26_24990 [Planctobacterium marinum]
MVKQTLNRAISNRIRNNSLKVNDFSKSIRVAFVQSGRGLPDSVTKIENTQLAKEKNLQKIEVSKNAKRFSRKYKHYFIAVKGG